MVETEESRMAFSPKEAPVYGGGTIVVALTEDTSFPEEAELFLVYEGANSRHVTTASKVSVNTLHSFIPVHGISEDVRLSVYQVHDGKTSVVCSDTFHYHYDSAYHMASFLVDSVYNTHALDDLELIKSEEFDLANEVVSTLDVRLVSALKTIRLPIGWNVLGSDTDSSCEDRETLLHFAARLGLREVSLFLLEHPGGEAATRVHNRHGQIPADIATEHGFQEVAEIISGYNTHGMVTVDTQRIEQDHGIIQHHSSGNTSLTTFQSTSQTSVEQDIDMLQESGAGMKRGGNSDQRHYESDWPAVKNGSPTEVSLVPCDTRMEQTIDRIFQERQAHHNMIGTVLGMPEYDIGADGDDDYESTDGGVRSRPSSFVRDGSESDIQEDFTQDPHWGVMEGSLNQLRGLNDGLQRYRDARVLSLRLNQDVRRDTLARFSSSCPSLDVQGRGSPLSPIDEADHHKSMLDLAQEVGDSSHLTADPTPSTFTSDPFRQHSASADGDVLGDRNIRICVNGVTVDSSTDLPDNFYMRQYDQTDFAVEDDVDGTGPAGLRRRSWCNEVVNQPRNPRETTRARMLAMTGKSMSLNSLDGDEESEEEDYQDARDTSANAAQTMRALSSASTPDRHKTNGSAYTDDRSLSPVDSTGSSPNVQEVSDASDYLSRTMSEPTTASPSTRSLTDLPFEMQQEEVGGVREVKKTPSYTVAATQGVCSCEEEYTGSLGVPHSSMTKSLSTPSIPAATEEISSTESRKLSLRRDGRVKDGKQPSGQSYTVIQKLLQDHDAQFRRQDEIEEEDENVAPVRRRREEMSLQDFLSESASFDLEDQRAKQRKEEERKKRKPSVFSRFQSSYRTKKSKDKDSKSKSSTPHQFVSISISNSTLCDVCHKHMAHKPALQCENCLMYVHEHNCKDQISSCDKNRRVLHREGNVSGMAAATSAMQERQVAPSSGSSLRPSHSFKDKRSSSAPVKSQPSLQPSSQFLPHRHSLPTPRAINEESEVDSIGSGTDVHSNMQDAISESMESLDATSVRAEVSLFDDEPDLMLEVDEPEAWSLTVDRKTLKKMNTKDIKRQDTIWELIQTEKEYCKTLKFMQKMFSQGLLQDLHMPQEQVERLFPQMDELIDIHTTFLRQLLKLQQQKQDRCVDEVGRTLLNQFEGENATHMKAVYGAFCSKHKEAVQLYKDFIKTDRKVQIFFKQCTNHSACKRRDVPDFILGVTIRLSKYPILIEAICKSTKDKKDRDLLSRTHHCSKGVLTDVNERVANYEKLVEIQSRIDSRATTVFKGKKFKRHDITLKSRKLVHTGVIGWKNARGRITDLLAVVLSDLIFFVQDSNQKYTFFVQDGKSCVIPLYKLLVREKRDTRDSHGIYLISQYSQFPEMYELVCRSKDDKESWIKVIQSAAENCPSEVEEEVTSTEAEEEKRKLEERASKAKVIIDQLHIKDSEIKMCCDEKNRLMLELIDLYKANDEPNSRPSSMHEETSGSESLEVLQAAMHEASRLATILQGSGTHLSRSVSSVGEHVSNSFVAMPVPKRAETFAGFDSSHDVPKGGLKKRFAPQVRDSEGRSPSLLSLDKQEGDSGMISTRMPEAAPMDPVVSDIHRQDSIKPASPLQRSIPHVWEEHDRGSDRSSDKGSLGELSASSISSLPPAPGNQEQLMSISQLVKYLHNLMNLTAQQGTAVESLRAQLAEANEKINKLSADMSDRKSGYRHNQLEELRNLQENISREKSEWEKEKNLEYQMLARKREILEDQRRQLEKQEADIRAKKDELQRQREALQKQIDLMRSQNIMVPSPFPSPSDASSPLSDRESSPQQVSSAAEKQKELVHRRSASAEFYSPAPEFDPVSHYDSSQHGDLSSSFSSNNRQPRHSVGNLHSVASSAASKQSLPMHLLSAKNEQKSGGGKIQQLPLKLSASGSQLVSQQSSSNTQQQQQQQQQPQLPHKQYSTGSINTAAASQNNMSGTQVQSRMGQSLRRSSPSRSAPSGLSNLMKLAEPGSGGRRRSPSQAAPGQQQSPPGSHKPGKPDDVYYF